MRQRAKVYGIGNWKRLPYVYARVCLGVCERSGTHTLGVGDWLSDWCEARYHLAYGISLFPIQSRTNDSSDNARWQSPVII